jgi:hypothetical protein
VSCGVIYGAGTSSSLYLFFILLCWVLASNDSCIFLLLLYNQGGKSKQPTPGEGYKREGRRKKINWWTALQG